MADPAPAPLWHRLTAGERWATVPNVITVARLALLPFVVVLLAQHQVVAATVLAVVAFVSDFADGYIARRFDQGSALGRWLDPLADRAAVVALAVGLALAGLLPVDLVVLAMVPDVTLGLVAALFFRGAPGIAVSWVGKVRTALQFTAFSLLLAAAAAREEGVASLPVARAGLVVFCAAIVASFVAGALYSASAARLLSGSGSADASPPDRGATAPP